jgi:hypothetical protein
LRAGAIGATAFLVSAIAATYVYRASVPSPPVELPGGDRIVDSTSTCVEGSELFGCSTGESGLRAIFQVSSKKGGAEAARRAARAQGYKLRSSRSTKGNAGRLRPALPGVVEVLCAPPQPDCLAFYPLEAGDYLVLWYR